MPIVGAHVSAAVSLDLSLERAQKIGAEVTQIFISPPQQWAKSKHENPEIEKYKAKVLETGIKPNFIHGTYLVNLATANPEHLQKSIDWLKYAMKTAKELGVTGVIFHTGSHKGLGFEKALDQICKALTTILNSSVIPAKAGIQLDPRVREDDKKRPYLILENSAGGGGSIGSKFSELGQILKKTGNDRLRVCIDTCHAFAAGYDIRTPKGLQSTLEEFESEIGLQNLVAFHANDSKFELGAGKDRHENIGEGFIGKEGFSNIVNNKAFKDIPFILEVPGFAGTGPDAENIQILKSLIK